MAIFQNNGWRFVAVAGFSVVVSGLALWYGYSIGLGDHAPEAVPLVEAPAQAWKVRPEDPGGARIPFQDKQIYAQVTQVADRDDDGFESLLPAPEQPMERPAPPPAEPEPLPGTVIDGSEPGMMPEGVTSGVTEDAGQPLPGSDLRGEELPGTRLPDSPAPDSQAPDSLLRQGQTVDGVPDQEESVSGAEEQQPTVSAPLPPARPAAPPPGPATTAAPAEPSTPAARAPARPAGRVSPAPDTGVRLQLAALRTEAAARATWADLRLRFPDVLGTRELQIERVNLGERGTYFRVQAVPVEDKETGKKLCQRIISGGGDCIVVGP